MPTPIASIPFAKRFLSRLKTTHGASPEGTGDIAWDAATETFRLANATGDTWNAYDFSAVGGGTPPAARVTTGFLSLSGITAHNITWGAETFDTDGMVDLGTNNDRITVKTAGMYAYGAYFKGVLNDPTGTFLHFIKKNGSTEILAKAGYIASGGAQVYAWTIEDDDLFSVNDYITAHLTLGNADASNQRTIARMWMRLVYAS